MRLRILFLFVLTSAVTLAQTAPSAQASSKGLELLNRVCSKYKDAKSYYIESVEERTSINEYRHDWERTVLRAAVSSENRYYYEGRSGFSNAVRVSDGKTIWTYHGNDHHYIVQSANGEKPDKHRVIPMAEMALLYAQNLRQQLSKIPKSLDSAEMLPDARVKINGRKLSCYVVRIRSGDEKRPSPNRDFEKTIWIDKERLLILRIVEHSHLNALLAGGTSIPIDEDLATTFSNTSLDGPVAESLFHFVPPLDAKLVDEFPDPRTGVGGNLLGEQAPPLKLRSANGDVLALDSFRGKPVLIDFWATWCAPCVTALPNLDKIYREARDKGLVLISVDRDEEAKTASDLLAKKGYTWPNFHDDGEIEKLVGSSGIPRTLLIDAQGKVVYDGSGSDDDTLRARIAKLGPEYEFLAEKKQEPCPASD
jgi:thiol-disulfide isomerase/thioredoxin/outer membrane lipoprotein-sorting protein